MRPAQLSTQCVDNLLCLEHLGKAQHVAQIFGATPWSNIVKPGVIKVAPRRFSLLIYRISLVEAWA